MYRNILSTTALLLCLAGSTHAQTASVRFDFAGTSATAPVFGTRIELMPVFRLIGAEASFSPAAGTYGVLYGGHDIQFAPGRTSVLVDGELHEARDVPVASPGGVAATAFFLERQILSNIGYRLESMVGGYRIIPGSRFADPVNVRPIAADFAATTTLVLNLNRNAEADVDSASGDTAIVLFADASPQIDSSVPFHSRRVRHLASDGRRLIVTLESGVGVTSWNSLENPPRVVLELGSVRPTPTAAPMRASENLGPSPIVIDPGHGGDDTGAVSAGGLVEKNLVLQISRRLAALLRAQGQPVRLTRAADEDRALSDRTALANRLNAKVFISLHANASTFSAVRGAETYYMSLDRSSTDEAAAATADLENRAQAGREQRSPLDLILWDLAQSEVLNESAKLALRVQQHLNSTLQLRDRGVKQAPFVVLTGATMPAALVEVGFLSNSAEGERLASPEHQQKIAEAIAAGIMDFVRN